MKMVKSLLLGTAAGVVAVAGAQAADLPVKAKPVQYVKICTLYGDGYYYIPGSDTCIKFGGYIQADLFYNDSAGQPMYSGTSGVQDRTVTPSNTRIRARIAIDTRTQTQYGTLRTLSAVTWQNQNQTESFNLNRGFIQFAGLTIGRIESFNDTWSLNDSYNMMSQQTGSDTSANGINSVDYTWELGNGATFTIGADERRTSSLSNLSLNSALKVGTAPTDSHAGEVWPDFIASFRIDQTWGYWAVSGAVHNVNQTYYAAGSGAGGVGAAGVNAIAGFSCVGQTAGAAVTTCGHASDQVGWNVGTGAEFKFPMFGAGDRGGFHFGYGQGAANYAGNASTAGIDLFGSNGSGSSLAIGWGGDGVYTNGSGIQLTTAWSVQGAYDHHWNAMVNTTAFVGYSNVSYNAQATQALNDAVGLNCGLATNGGQFGAAVNSGSGATVQTGLAGTKGLLSGSNCSPNYQLLETGIRTNWVFAPGFYFALQASYIYVWTAYQGDTLTAGSANWIGGRPAGTFTLSNQGILLGLARVYRSWNID